MLHNFLGVTHRGFVSDDELGGKFAQSNMPAGITDPQNTDGLKALEKYQKYKGELFNVLCSLTAGEAKTIVQNVSKKGVGQNGFGV